MHRVLLALAAALALSAVHASGAAALAPSVLGEDPLGHGVFRFPQALAFSPGAQHVFVGDQYSSVVQQFTRDGTWERDIAFRADARQTGRIGTIGGLAGDRQGHLYVLDSENDRVQVFAMATGQWLAAFGSTGTGAGTFRLGHNTGAGGIALLQPTAAATPVVYIADQYNHRIQRFTLGQTTPAGERVLPAGARDPANGAVAPIPTPDVIWGHAGDCSSGTCADPEGSLFYPQGIAVDPDPGRVFIADDDNHRVVETDLDGTFVAVLGHYGIGPGQFRFPYDVAVDARQPQQLYVADNNNHRVQAFDATSLAFLRTWGSFTRQVGGLEYIRALSALADDPAGGVAATDTAGNRVHVFAADGRLAAAWGVAGRGPGYVTGPRGVAVDAQGGVAVADTLDARVARFDADGTYAGQVGLVSTNSLFTFPGSADGQLDTPSGVAFDTAGNLWIADTANNRVAQVAPDGSWIGASGGFNAPAAVAAGADGAVYVADTANNRIRRRDEATGAWAVVAFGTTSLDAPGAVALGPDGTLYVADAAHVYARSPGGAVTAIPAPAGATWSNPGGLAVDATTLYVANDEPGKSAVLSRTGSAWTTVAGDGHGAGDVIAPGGLAMTADGTLFVADTGNDRVLRLDPAGVAPAPKRTLSVTVDGLTRGTVTSAPEGIWCPTDCTQGIAEGRDVALTATPAPGWQFAGWGGACSGGGACTVRMDSARSVSAAFSPTPQPPPPAPLPPPPPSSGAAPPPPPLTPRRDRAAPRLTRLRLAPRTLRRATRARLRFTLSERATIVMTVQQARTGRRAGSTCVAPSRTNRRRSACTRWITLSGHRTLHLPGGAATARITRRPAGRTLAPGRYRLALSARDAAGNRAAPRTIRFVLAR